MVAYGLSSRHLPLRRASLACQRELCERGLVENTPQAAAALIAMMEHEYDASLVSEAVRRPAWPLRTEATRTGA